MLTQTRHPWGVYLPNDGPFSIEDVMEVVGNGCYTCLHHQSGLCVRQVRRRFPQALIQIRCYLQSWVAVDARSWAHECFQILHGGADPLSNYTRNFTWANEQNLADESGGLVGASRSRLATWNDYKIIAEWNEEFIGEYLSIPGSEGDVPHYPAMAYGHGEDWGYDGNHQPMPGFPLQDGVPAVAYEVLRSGIDRVPVLNMHPYVQAGSRWDDEWTGARRIEKALALFPGKPIFVSETGQFNVVAQDAPDTIKNIGYYLQGLDQVIGFTPFIWSSPDPGHASNDWSRNSKIADAYKETVRVTREYRIADPTASHPPAPPVPPSPPEPPGDPPGPPVVVVPPASPAGPGGSPVMVTLHKRAYIHQFDQLGEKSVAEIAATLRLGGITEVSCKTHQELTWLGRASSGDRSPLAFKALADVVKRFEEFKTEGIRMVPWCVPMGTRVPDEVRMAIDVGLACGGLVELDTEPYTDFWEGPYNGLEPYTDGIQEGQVSYEMDFDARPGGWNPFTSAQFARVCRDASMVWTQTYWGTAGFSTDAVSEVNRAIGVLLVLGVPIERRGIIFPHQGHASYAEAAAAMSGKAHAVGMWKMGEAGKPVFDALKAIQEPRQSDPMTDPARNVATVLRDKYVEPAYALALRAMAESDPAAIEWGTATRSQAVLLKKALGFPS